MIAFDDDSLTCDLAETYHILDYRELSPLRVALFSIGLRDNSRIRMKMSGLNCSFDTLMFASMVDRLSMLVWSKTKDAEHNRNRPDSISEKLLHKEEESVENDFVVFDSVEAFEEALNRINGGT